MARASADQYNLLDRWRDVMSESVWRFNQLIDDNTSREPNAGKHIPYIQRDRDRIADALTNAVNGVWPYLGYPPVTSWVGPVTLAVNRDASWKQQTYSLPDGYVQAIGKRATALVAANVSVAYDDSDDDGILDRATVSTTLTGDNTALDEQTFVACFRSADGALTAGNLDWTIYPLTITRSSNTVTLTGHRAVFTHPNVWAQEYLDNTYGAIEKPEQARSAGTVTDAADYVSAVDIYRVYPDTTTAVQLISFDPVAGQVVTNVSAGIVDYEYGQVRLYVASGQSEPTHPPHSVRLWYKAGLTPDDKLYKTVTSAICRYANILMPQTPSIWDRSMQMWDDDRMMVDRNFIMSADAKNPPPFGFTNAGYNMWKTIQPENVRLVTKAKIVTQR
jgi:hypothetical protein